MGNRDAADPEGPTSALTACGWDKEKDIIMEKNERRDHINQKTKQNKEKKKLVNGAECMNSLTL